MKDRFFSPRLWFFLFLSVPVIALSACARPPVQDMADARVAVAAADEAGAPARAPEKFAEAGRLYDRSLKNAERSDYGRARTRAVEARKVALEAEEMARRGGVAESVPFRLPEEAARRPESPPVAPEPLARVKPEGEPSASMSPQARPADRHVVEKGESLWKISGYPGVYNDPLKWPLLYRANRDRIADPDRIHPGQELKIERNAKPEEVAESVRTARTRGPWSLWDGR